LVNCKRITASFATTLITQTKAGTPRARKSIDVKSKDNISEPTSQIEQNKDSARVPTGDSPQKFLKTEDNYNPPKIKKRLSIMNSTYLRNIANHSDKEEQKDLNASPTSLVVEESDSLRVESDPSKFFEEKQSRDSVMSLKFEEIDNFENEEANEEKLVDLGFNDPSRAKTEEEIEPRKLKIYHSRIKRKPLYNHQAAVSHRSTHREQRDEDIETSDLLDFKVALQDNDISCHL